MDSIFILVLKALFVISVIGKYEKYGFPGTGIAFHKDTAVYQPLISGVVVATKTLKDLKNDFDEDTSKDIAAVSSGKQSRINAIKTGVTAGIKKIFKPFGSKKLIMITAGGTILFICLITVGIFLLGKSPEKAPEKTKETQDTAPVKDEIKPPLPAEAVFEDIVILKPFEHIQLKEGSSIKQISMTLSLELSDSRYKKEVHAMDEKIRQIIELQLNGMTWLELRNPEGKIMLKYELLKQMNSLFAEVMIRNIYFTNFLMQ